MGKCINCFSEHSEWWTDLNDIFEDHHFFHKCANCGIFFLNPQPTEEQLKRAYDESYYGLGEKKFNPFLEDIVEWFRQRNAKSFAKRIQPKGNVLDIGCGNGNFLHTLGKFGEYGLYGIEPEGGSADRAARHNEIHLIRGVLKKDTFPKDFFDAVSLTHVFEHLPNPQETIDIIDEISKKGAVLQIEIPNINSWQASIFRGKWLHLDPPRHLNMFPPEILKEEWAKRGWKLLKEHYFSPQFSPFGVQQSLLNLVLRKREVLYEHLKENKEYTREYGRTHLFAQQLFQWLSFPLFVVTDAVASMAKKGGTVKLLFKKDQ